MCPKYSALKFSILASITLVSVVCIEICLMCVLTAGYHINCRILNGIVFCSFFVRVC